MDLNGDGIVATDGNRGTREYGDDSFGFGTYPGQYSIAVLSHHPLITGEARTFQYLPWRDLAGNHIPEGFYSDTALQVMRLSSKSHQDVPAAIDGVRFHLLLSHPTPPVFDGDEDRNGRRNFDEIMLWVRYIDGDKNLVDDRGRTGGYGASAPFVIIGDLNAAEGGEPVYDGINAIDQLLGHTAIQDSGAWAVSDGACAADQNCARAARATTEFDGRPRRIDYVLPSRGVEILDGGVYWPAESEDPAGHALALLASDHRMVWLDLRLPPH